MIVHKLKSWKMFYRDIITGNRKADIRTTYDRDFKVGDHLHLHEWDPIDGTYTGRVAVCIVTYIQTNQGNPCAVSYEAIANGYAVLSIDLQHTVPGSYDMTKELSCQD